jgi:hypothetical protein
VGFLKGNTVRRHVRLLRTYQVLNNGIPIGLSVLPIFLSLAHISMVRLRLLVEFDDLVYMLIGTNIPLDLVLTYNHGLFKVWIKVVFSRPGKLLC